MIEQAPALIIAVPLVASLLNLIIGSWRKDLCWPLAVLALRACLFCSVAALGAVMGHGALHYRFGGWPPPWGIEYAVDHLSSFMAVIVSFASLLAAVYSLRSVGLELPGRTVHFYTVFLLLVAGLQGIVLTGDVFNLYVFLEIASLAGYALIAVGSGRAPLASFNYVIMGTVGACFYLLGVGYLYIVTGSLNMADLSLLLPEVYGSRVVIAAFAFFMVGVSVKMAFFPLHAWLPDAYTHAPSTVSAFVASTMTKVGAYVMIRIMFTVFRPWFSVEMLPAAEILGWVSVAAMLYGSILAVGQTDLKRMLSFVLVAEVGYIVMGVSVANVSGLTGAVLHILNDSFMMACLFFAAGAVVYKTGSREIRLLAQAYRKMPLTMAAFALAAVSVVGIPPTCGFFSKWYLVIGAIDAGRWEFAGALLASSLINALVFYRVMETVYFGPRAGRESVRRDEAPLSMLVPVCASAAGILVLGILSGRIVESVIRFTLPAGF